MVEIKDDSTMIVLGAGASMGATLHPLIGNWRQSHWKWRKSISTLPSARNFFYDLFKQRKTVNNSARFINYLGLMYEGVNDFIVRAWGLSNNSDRFDVEEWKNLNIEDLYTYLDTGEKMYLKGTDYQIAFQKAKGYLEDFIVTILSVKSSNLYCKKLLKLFSTLKPYDNIISFNWDTVADNTLIKLQCQQLKNYQSLISHPNFSLKNYRNKGLLLKLHGSLSWLICLNKKCRRYNVPVIPDDKVSSPQELMTDKHGYCAVCRSKKVKRLIVPPVSNKVFHSNTFLHKLWLLSRNKLSHTGKIIFIGYSFPATDFYSEWLFRQMYFLKDRKTEIIIINRGIFKKDSSVAKRYNSIFRNFKITRYRDLDSYLRTI